MSKIRKQIVEALDSLSGTVQWSEDFLEIYCSDADLIRKAEELYLALLEGIEGMTEWLDERAYIKAVKAIFLQGSFGAPVEKRIASIEDKSAAFQKRIDLLLHRQVRDLRHENQAARREQQIANQTLIVLLRGLIQGANCQFLIFKA